MCDPQACRSTEGSQNILDVATEEELEEEKEQTEVQEEEEEECVWSDRIHPDRSEAGALLQLLFSLIVVRLNISATCV